MKRQKIYVTMLLMTMAILVFTGCGMTKNKDKDNAEATTGWSVENPDRTTEDKKTTATTGDINGNEGGVTNHLGEGTFDTYEDAKNYLMEKLESDNEDIAYEFREETKDLTSYDSDNPGAEGYQFHVYESEGGKKTGDYYVDKDTGKVYRYTNDNKITEY